MEENATAISVGLRVDVDTFRGTRDGVPRLIETLDEFNIHASFFFSVGPDNMGRHLWRLLKPAFLMKMLRSNAPGLYGWDILLRGTLWPGPSIGKRLSDIIKSAEDKGHETGLHAWDHHRWQASMTSMSNSEIRYEIQQGIDMLNTILDNPVNCSAVAGWICNDDVLLEKNEFRLKYNSDCRGKYIFRPEVDHTACTPQIPVTLPTYDEAIGINNINDDNYNEYILGLIKPDQLNVLAIHAEVEGISKNQMFKEFLKLAPKNKINFYPLGELLPDDEHIPAGKILNQDIKGREGQICWQLV
jgi:undecaprenyl phosphate-alpha-L-ara4FN deformylase